MVSIYTERSRISWLHGTYDALQSNCEFSVPVLFEFTTWCCVEQLFRICFLEVTPSAWRALFCLYSVSIPMVLLPIRALNLALCATRTMPCVLCSVQLPPPPPSAKDTCTSQRRQSLCLLLTLRRQRKSSQHLSYSSQRVHVSLGGPSLPLWSSPAIPMVTT